MELPHAMEPLAGCIAAGLPVRTACAAVVQSFDGSVADDLGQVLSLMDLGVADAEAWRTLHEHPQLGLVAADLSRSSSREPRWWRACNTTAATVTKVTVGQYVKLQVWTSRSDDLAVANRPVGTLNDCRR
jgi:hypothetical protein